MNFIINNRNIKHEYQEIIGDNADYMANFTFDAEWDGKIKTARFTDRKHYKDVLLVNDSCKVPREMLKQGELRVGVYTEEMTSTFCIIKVTASIKEWDGPAAPPSDDIYAQLLDRIENLQMGGVSEAQIAAAVGKYLTQHPIEESDPTVPSWAKQTDPPSYTAEDVGALPADTAALPNPHKLILTGGVTAEYDGSGAVTVTMPEGGDMQRIEKTSTDTIIELQPNKLYVFPEMTSLTYTLAAGGAKVANEYHFIFKSGAAPTEVVHPEGVNVGNLTVEVNKIYEISVMENMLTSQSWEVS